MKKKQSVKTFMGHSGLNFTKMSLNLECYINDKIKLYPTFRSFFTARAFTNSSQISHAHLEVSLHHILTMTKKKSK